MFYFQVIELQSVFTAEDPGFSVLQYFKNPSCPCRWMQRGWSIRRHSSHKTLIGPLNVRRADWKMSGEGGGRHVSLTVTSGHSHRTLSPRLQTHWRLAAYWLHSPFTHTLTHTLAQPSPFPILGLTPSSRSSGPGLLVKCGIICKCQHPACSLLRPHHLHHSGRSGTWMHQVVRANNNMPVSEPGLWVTCSGKTCQCFSNLCWAQRRSRSDCQFSSESKQKADGERVRR